MGRRAVIGRQHLRIRVWNRRRPFRAKVEIISILGCRGCRGLKSWTLKSPLALTRVVFFCQRSTDLVIAACILPPKRESAVNGAVLSEFTPCIHKIIKAG
ncbi:hypothetical protein DPMN_114755 [Dreissena polymorpha]|uniref:Uncharacterized protein n=1 Tax=Dreissena polymorpha TaxID=45954 RepID=A0A9D4KKH7_DREPO|nr:hypothetical protein DPMN_114755 [Dreissena polymorpha]